MLVDPSFATELGIPQGAQTLAFVKKVLMGLAYVDIQAVGAALTCQVKSGDGQNKTAVTDIMVRVAFTGVAIPPAAPVPPTISVSVGTLKSGTGTNILWIQSTNTGAFSLSISGATGNLLVEMTPKQGVAMSVGLSL
jgi:hypothetical protein